jgi:hypothetical protein
MLLFIVHEITYFRKNGGIDDSLMNKLPKGIENPTRSLCYMNSLFQALFHIPVIQDV